MKVFEGKDTKFEQEDIKSPFNLPLIQADNRPTDYEYALLSEDIYRGEAIKKGQLLAKQKEWKVWAFRAGDLNYIGAIYFNAKTQQTVLVHQGTYSLGAIVEDFQGVCSGKISPQKKEIFTFIQEAIEFSKDMGFRLSFTGHSLGAFLAELSVYYCHRSLNYPHVSAVTFESPGCWETLENLQPNQPQGRIDLNQLDIVSYLSYPNLVNSCNHHVGTLYALETDLGQYGWVPLWHLKQVHTMVNIVKFFETNEDYIPAYVIDWPMGSQRDYFFQYACFENGTYKMPEEQEEEIKSGKQKFALDYQGHYSIHPQFNSKNTLPLINFTPEVQEWLKIFYKGLRLYLRINNFNIETATKKLKEYVEAEKVDETIIRCLMASTIIQQQNGVKLFCVLVDASVYSIRKELSTWLESNPDAAGKLLSFVLQGYSVSKKGEIIVEFTQGGAKIAQGAEVEARVQGASMEFPIGASDDDIRHLQELSRHFLQSVADTGTNIRVNGLKKDDVIEGKLRLYLLGSGFSAQSGSPASGIAPLLGQRWVKEGFTQSSSPSDKPSTQKSGDDNTSSDLNQAQDSSQKKM